MICEICQQTKANRARRGPLSATDSPAQVFYKGRLLPITGYRARLLMHLIRFGKASNVALMMIATGEEVRDPARQLSVVICHIRKRLPEGVRIETLHRWGYELVVETNL